MTKKIIKFEVPKYNWLDGVRKDENNLSFWYPKIKDCGLNVPKTVIISVSDELVECASMERENDFDEILCFVKNQVMPALKETNIRILFVKNGTFSNKFDFACCKPKYAAHCIASAFVDINYTALCYGAGGYTEFVLRERIPFDETKIPTIYNGMPLRPEFRVFYDFDNRKLLYSVNYWGYDYCHDSICRNASDRIVYEHYYNHIAAAFDQHQHDVEKMVEDAMKNVDLKGRWSIDILYEEENDCFWLIDMAKAEKSAYWDARS